MEIFVTQEGSADFPSNVGGGTQNEIGHAVRIDSASSFGASICNRRLSACDDRKIRTQAYNTLHPLQASVPIQYSSCLYKNFHFGLRVVMAIGEVADTIASFAGDESAATSRGPIWTPGEPGGILATPRLMIVLSEDVRDPGNNERLVPWRRLLPLHRENSDRRTKRSAISRSEGKWIKRRGRFKVPSLYVAMPDLRERMRLWLSRSSRV